MLAAYILKVLLYISTVILMSIFTPYSQFLFISIATIIRTDNPVLKFLQVVSFEEESDHEVPVGVSRLHGRTGATGSFASSILFLHVGLKGRFHSPTWSRRFLA